MIHLKLFNCEQANDYYPIEMITWKNIIVYRIWEEYLKPYEFVQIISVSSFVA